RVKRGTLKASDLLAAQIERIQKYDQAVNAVVVRDFDEARREAERMDRIVQHGSERQKQMLGPLAGVPITVKESYDLKGLPSTFGRVEMRANIAQSDALMVSRLKQAGAIVMGKTNVPVRLSDWQSFNPIYGTTNNPYDLTRVPGGSSGGGAAALAAGFSFLELGRSSCNEKARRSSLGNCISFIFACCARQPREVCQIRCSRSRPRWLRPIGKGFARKRRATTTMRGWCKPTP
ncbi:MAG: hypothetical protein EB006_04470, partial [Betaproteobacteria bacterium]|nr:hypothetical protein [Betaproteobacteria bacterium]